MTRFDARVWTDGSTDGEGYGGCAAILQAPSGKLMVVTDGQLAPTTNQRMELKAAVLALNTLWWRPDTFDAFRVRRNKRIVVYSDSAYLVNCFLEGWIPNWRKRGWRASTGKPVKNRELWETLENLVVQYKHVEFVHVKGHAGNRFNELADEHAVKTRIAMSIRGPRLGGPGAERYEAERTLDHIISKEWRLRTAKTRSKMRRRKR